MVQRAASEVGHGANRFAGAAADVGRGAGKVAADVGRGAGKVAADVGRGAGKMAADVGRGAGKVAAELPHTVKDLPRHVRELPHTVREIPRHFNAFNANRSFTMPFFRRSGSTRGGEAAGPPQGGDAAGTPQPSLDSVEEAAEEAKQPQHETAAAAAPAPAARASGLRGGSAVPKPAAPPRNRPSPMLGLGLGAVPPSKGGSKSRRSEAEAAAEEDDRMVADLGWQSHWFKASCYACPLRGAVPHYTLPGSPAAPDSLSGTTDAVALGLPVQALVLWVPGQVIIFLYALVRGVFAGVQGRKHAPVKAAPVLSHMRRTSHPRSTRLVCSPPTMAPAPAWTTPAASHKPSTALQTAGTREGRALQGKRGCGAAPTWPWHTGTRAAACHARRHRLPHCCTHLHPAGTGHMIASRPMQASFSQRSCLPG